MSRAASAMRGPGRTSTSDSSAVKTQSRRSRRARMPRQPGRVTQWPELALHFPERAPVSALHPDCPRGLGLLRLRTLELPEAQRFMRALCCHQDIASTGAFTVAMLGEFDATLDAHGGHGYRLLLREAGQIGQALYLEAEAAGLRGTGVTRGSAQV